MKTLALLVLSTVLTATPACKKPDGDKPSPMTAAGSNTTGSAAMATPNPRSAAMAGSATVGSGSSSGSDNADNEDRIVVLGRHRPAKPTDPVSVRFDKFRVVKATFDPKKIEGGTATIELDLASLRTGSGERDEDLESPTYIDVAKFATPQ